MGLTIIRVSIGLSNIKARCLWREERRLENGKEVLKFVFF